MPPDATSDIDSGLRDLARRVRDQFATAPNEPELRAIKAQVLGLNAAHLFHLDPHATRCALESDPITGARMVAAHLRTDDVLPAPSRPNGPTTRREMLQWLASPATRWTPA